MTWNEFNPFYLWHLLTRLGEAQILLPTVMVAVVSMLRRREARPLAMWWLALLGAATLLTSVSKVAFIGWGLGWAELNFTGISGHTMFASAVCPVLLAALTTKMPRAIRYLAVIIGAALAVLVGVSRVVIHVHSVSEVLAGLLLGGSVSAAILAWVRLPGGLFGPAIAPTILLWLVLTPLHSPAVNTHSLITTISLTLSGRETPYTRQEMLRKLPTTDT
ncbi:membrane-associated phospholipid phosphatase [Variovorax boronicumulans]|uniref:phosphatase PAP2 family protein n=1 Tax=Variovorax boronicumulans TaxID=436515 RepID=UPI002787DB2A|nr:phosphatase PAP2 family protein [Variovorax boronicumulans]MDP9912359.1 membrane-associated phospholipid phosphatase [Variovorax boronicumulans]